MKSLIWYWHRWQAQRHYRAMDKIADGADCGRELLREVSLTYCQHEKKLNYHVGCMKVIDGIKG